MNIILIVKKLEQMEGHLEELKISVLCFTPQKVKKEITLLHTAERLVQLIVDTMIDINIHILISKEKTYDKTQSTFLLLGELGILEREFAEKIAPIVGLRNILVHGYEKIDKDLFVRNLFRNVDDFKRYIVYIHEFITKTKK